MRTRSWRTTYVGLMPAEFLAGLRVERRQQYWAGLLADPNAATHVFVAEVGPDVVGFAACGPNREAPTEYAGELYAIYVLADRHGQGLGRGLYDAVVADLTSRHMASMVIWVLANNPACGFYARMGGQRVAEKDVEIGGVALREVAYGWASR